MDAIKLLKQQHQEVAELFTEFKKARVAGDRRALFEDIADKLAVHSEIEERFFYPALRAESTEDDLELALDEHRDLKHLVLDALDAQEAPGFEVWVSALKATVAHHVEEEESVLFPAARRLLDSRALESLGAAMQRTADELNAGAEPRILIRLALEAPTAHA